MRTIADLQLHSKFSRAVSKDMVLPQICAWTRRKGMGLVATGDWTHPLWMKEIKNNLVETGSGFLKLKHAASNDPLFLLATEVSCIYSQAGKGRRVHTLIWVPTLAAADRINKEMTKQGCNLLSDGRPIIGLTSMQVAELVLAIEPNALIMPAHAWTPWFGVYGSMSGFDSLEEAYGSYAKYIYAVETGLSSNPAMNWRIAELDHRSIVSFSDAHSGAKLGREATVFELKEMTYASLFDAIKGSAASKILYTIEFFPEEGKYHWSGHRSCNIRWSPSETALHGTACPVCGKSLTQGVEQRVSELALRSESDLKLRDERLGEGFASSVRITKSGLFPDRPGYTSLVPLIEIIAECMRSPVTSPKVQATYTKLTDALGGEFAVLLATSHNDIVKIAGERVAIGIDKVRKGDIVIDPGYDGVFGIVKLWREDEEKPLIDAARPQLSIF